MEQNILRARWETKAESKERIIAALKAGVDLRTLMLPLDSIGKAEKGQDFDGTSGLVDLRGISLEDVNLSGVNLQGLDLSFATLFKVSLEGANLSSAHQESKFFGSKFLHCDLRGAVVYGANCGNSHFGHCDLSQVNFSWTNLDSATLRSSNLAGANLTGASLRDVEFIHSDLRGIKLSPDTAVGVSENAVLHARIRLEDEARTLACDRFQFATQAEAFDSAAELYGNFAEASEKNGMSAAGMKWRSRQNECLQSAERGVPQG
jgi:uncharacterized protein YjbI with pentapeptide repeats